MNRREACDYWRPYIRIAAFPNMWDERVRILVVRREQGKPQQVGRLQFTEVPEGESLEGTAELDRSEAQELMDMLWACGLRPTQGKQSEGQVAAVERHLADMRTLAFAMLEIKQP
jgi:hypothetical protein